MSKKVSYVVMGLFVLIVGGVAAWGLSTVPTQAKENACYKVQENTCDFLVACSLTDHKNRKECEEEFNAEAFCTQVIKSSVEQINQCASDLKELVSCKESLPESCYSLR
jgi:hypothetical protein